MKILAQPADGHKSAKAPAKQQRIIQNAWVVPDLDKAMRDWTHSLGVGPFLELPPIAPDTYLYRGSDVRPNMRVGLVQSGEVQVEFMQLMSPGPSVYQDVFAFGTGGFHHICVMTDDFDQDIAHHISVGLDVPLVGHNGELRFAFVDARPTLGCMLEIVSDSPLLHHIYRAVRQASEGWDGSDPVRPFTF